LLHIADLGYQVCGDGTRAVLCTTRPVWGRDETWREEQTEFITTPNDFVPQFFLYFTRV
jgi:hypothetical protein